MPEAGQPLPPTQPVPPQLQPQPLLQLQLQTPDSLAWPVRLVVALLWMVVTGALAWLYCQPAWTAAQVAASGGQVVRQALVAPEPVVGPWRAVALPHGADGLAPSPVQRYRLAFELSPGQAGVPQGLCLERRILMSDVWLDGRRLAVDPSAPTATLRGMRPQHLSLPPDLAAGHHLLDLRLAAPPAPLEPYLSAAWLGEDHAVGQGCDAAASRMAELPAIMLGSLAASGALALVVGWLLRDAAARWFALAALAWAANLLVYSTALLPWARAESGLVLWLLPLLRLLVCGALVLFCLRQAELRLPRLERGLLATVVAAVVLQLLLPHDLRWLGRMVLLALLCAMLAGTLALMARQALRRAALSADALFLALLVGLLTTLANALRLFDWQQGLPPLLMILVVPLLTGGIGLLMAERLGLLYARQRSVATWLQTELQRHQALLQQSFETLRRQRDAEVEAAARQRITRELHDGLGSHLVAAAALLASNRPAPGDRLALVGLVDQALQELRSALDAITSEAGDLAELLGALRDRLEPVLVARAIDLDWQVASLPGTVGLGVAERLDVLRIVQEAFANIVKHAGPCQATLLARPTAAGGSLIVIADNGLGWQAGRRDGVGLPSMRERARRLNAGLEVGPASPGCRVALSLPPPPAEAAPWDGLERRLTPRPPAPQRQD